MNSQQKPVNKKNKKKSSTPVHVGIILDGNKRWARTHNLNKKKGYENARQPLENTILSSIELGISYISLFVLSTENWKRPKTEITFLQKLFAEQIQANYDFYSANKVRIVLSGNTAPLQKKLLHVIDEVRELTKKNTGIVVNIACNYGGKDEIIRAVKRYMAANKSPNELTEEIFAQYFDVPELPEMDLLIRTGMQKRISNFLLWKLAYAELYFSDTLWPQWSQEDFYKAIDFFRLQKRNFGTH